MISHTEGLLKDLGQFLTPEQKEDVVRLGNNLVGHPVGFAWGCMIGRCVLHVLVNNGLRTPVEILKDKIKR